MPPRAALALLLLALALGGARAMDLNLLSTAGGNTCNDGSPAGYWLGLAPSPTSSWLVHLQGGAWCQDDKSCLSRAVSQPNLVTSTVWPQKIGLRGLFNRSHTDNPVAAYNHVYVGYCSSDGWAGARDPVDPSANFSESTDAWAFKGHAIVLDVLDDLADRHGLGAGSSPGNPASVVFSGCSAGGQGVVVNADFVREHLEDALGAESVRVVALGDAAWLVDSEPAYPSVSPIRAAIQDGVALWTPEFDSSCVAAREHAWECFFSPYAVPYISTPVFIHAAQNDLYQLPVNGIGSWPPKAGTQAEWVAAFRAHFISTISQNSNVFSSACHHHCSTEGPSMYEILFPPDNRTLAQALGAWLGGSASHSVDTCPGLTGCSKNCPAVGF